MIQLTQDQKNASDQFTQFLMDSSQKYMVIAGAAGTGKSTLVRYILDTLAVKKQLMNVLMGGIDDDEDDEDTSDMIMDYTVELTATTNKAAAVLSELTGKPCSTIHARLGLIPRENYETGEIRFVRGRDSVDIYDSLIIIDEGSFLDDYLLELIDACTPDCKVVIIGDQYQLAPVKQEVPIMDTIQGTKVVLDKIMRHGGIIAEVGAQFRHAVKTGEFQPIKIDGKYIKIVDGNTFQGMIVNEFTHPEYTGDKARVLAWKNDTVNRYNMFIRQIRGSSVLYEEGDVLMTSRPIYSTGRYMKLRYTTDATVRISNIGPNTIQYDIPGRWVQLRSSDLYFLPDDPIQAMKFMTSLKRKKEWKLFFKLQKEWLDLRPAFASTVHKSQGSTYDTVYINLSDIGCCQIPSDVARMLYVAITRAAKRVILYGQLPLKYRGQYNENASIEYAELST